MFALNNLPQGTRAGLLWQSRALYRLRNSPYPTKKQDPTEFCAVPGRMFPTAKKAKSKLSIVLAHTHFRS